MSYMTDKWNAGEVHTQDGACGWLMKMERSLKCR